MKILIIHYRVGKTDGVSLEIGAWREILIRMGNQLKLAGGPESIGADFVIQGLENQLDQEVFNLQNEAFGGLKQLTEPEFNHRIMEQQAKLAEGFEEIIREYRPDRVIVSNIFSVGENIAAAGALASVLARNQIPTVGVHHDFYWETIRYKKPSNKLVEEQLNMYFPPTGDWISHACINSIAQKELKVRNGIEPKILYDTLDFEIPMTGQDTACRALLESHGVRKEDLVVLQSTRIVRRKNIEISIDLVKKLEQKSGRRVALVLAGYAEKRDLGYLQLLQQYAKSTGIFMVELNGLSSIFINGSDNKCDLLSMYSVADIVTYPSEYEGFGNQFLEAVYAKKPVVIWEYPVYQTDIKPLGFKAISLGDKLIKDSHDGLVKIETAVLDQAANEVIQLMSDHYRRVKMVEDNYEIARKHFSYEQTAEVWKELLSPPIQLEQELKSNTLFS
jgi:mannosylglucosylglycerate synthase